MPDIPALTLRVQRLTQSVDWWNTAVVFTLVLAAIAAIAVVIATRYALVRSRDLANAQGQLISAKDEQLTRDLKVKDLDIAGARKEAGVANRAAGEANRSAGLANQAAGDANERAAQLEVKAEHLHKENLDLESELSPRIFKDQYGAGKALEPFAPVNAVIEYLPDRECRDTAGQIALTLHDFAKWKLLSVNANSDESEFFDGVIVQIKSAGPVGEEVKRAEAGAEALISELNKTNIKARRHASARNFPEGVVVIRVGMKPNPALERIIREAEEKIRRPKP